MLPRHAEQLKVWAVTYVMYSMSERLLLAQHLTRWQAHVFGAALEHRGGPTFEMMQFLATWLVATQRSRSQTRHLRQMDKLRTRAWASRLLVAWMRAAFQLRIARVAARQFMRKRRLVLQSFVGEVWRRYARNRRISRQLLSRGRGHIDQVVGGLGG